MRLACVSFITLLPGLAFGQDAASPPAFDIADVHVSPKSTTNALNLSGTGIRGGLLEMHRATLVDLIRLAYSMDIDRILGGPAWLEINRYEIRAKSPASTPTETVRLMLQSLLADRFKLVVHNETKDLPGLALSAPKKPQLKEPDGSASPGCRTAINTQALQQANARVAGPDGPPVPIIPMVSYTCHSVTMKTFAEGMRGLQDTSNNGQIVNHTGIEGVWDVTVQFSLPTRNAPSGADYIPLSSALDKLGFKLETLKVPTPVIRVDSANDKPTDNLPGIEANFPPPLPAEFEVADIRPSDPAATGSSLGMQPGGRLTVRNMFLQTLLTQALGANIDDIVGAPKFVSTVHYDIIAKANVEGNQAINLDTMRPLLLALLKDRFKLAYHTEVRPTTAYNLTAPKPKLQNADPTNRTSCKDGLPPDGKDPRVGNPALTRVVTCQNITMSQFADELLRIGSGYYRTPVLDMTGLAGAWDFSFAFSAPALVNGTARITTPDGNPSDPTGAVSLFDAVGKIGLKLEQTKRPAPVFVIDHLEEKPTDN